MSRYHELDKLSFGELKKLSKIRYPKLPVIGKGITKKTIIERLDNSVGNKNSNIFLEQILEIYL